MAFPVTKIQSSDKLNTVRTKYNEMIDTFENFSFEDSDLYFTGAIYQTEERVILNEGETQAGSIGKLPGIEIERGTATNQILIWDESTDTWKVGTESVLVNISLEGHLHDSDYYRNDEDIVLGGNKIINAEGEDGIEINSGNVTVTGNISGQNLEAKNSTTPTKMEVYNTYTDVSNYERGFVKFESNVMKIGNEHSNGTLREMGIVQTGLMKFYSYQATVNDDASFTLPAITNSAWGFVTVGSNVQSSMFTIAADGTASLISETVSIVANADTDDKFCIGTSVASPVIIKNRLGSNYNVNLMLFYN